jgi:hypothetical protein
MMQQFTLTLTISADGTNVDSLVEGMKGHKCDSVQAIIGGIGDEIEHRHTPDFDAPEPVFVSMSGTVKTIKAGR